MKRRNVAVIPCFAVFILIMISVVSYAFTEADLDKLMKTKQCQWCDLRKADFSGADLSGANLANANLSGANLSGADLSSGNLSGALLRNANLKNANLSNAYLGNANLNGADLDKINLNGAELSDAVWTNGVKCEKGSFKVCKFPNITGSPVESFQPFPDKW